MPHKPSPERIFRSHFPRATIERQKPHLRAPYYLVRKEPREFMWAGAGSTRAQAWADACARLGLTAVKPTVPANTHVTTTVEAP